jgi:hypothetical protein
MWKKELYNECATGQPKSDKRDIAVDSALLCEMVFVADNIPFSSQRRSGGGRLSFD